MVLTSNISIGDILVIVAMGASIVYNYAVYAISIKFIRQELADLKRGRGLILDNTSNWPTDFKALFGVNGRGEFPPHG